jgi:hypothetical protein
LFVVVDVAVAVVVVVGVVVVVKHETLKSHSVLIFLFNFFEKYFHSKGSPLKLL